MRHAREILTAASRCQGHESKYELMACPDCLRSQGLMYLHLAACVECRAEVLAEGLAARARLIQSQLDDLGPEPPF